MTGLLRVDSPLFAFEMALPPILAKLAQEHPGLTVEVITGRMHVDIVAQGFDAGVGNRRWIHSQYGHGAADRTLQDIIVASGSYLAPEARRSRSADLHQHNCIGFHHSSSGAIFDSELMDAEEARRCENVGTALVTGPLEAMSSVLAG